MNNFYCPKCNENILNQFAVTYYCQDCQIMVRKPHNDIYSLYFKLKSNLYLAEILINSNIYYHLINVTTQIKLYESYNFDIKDIKDLYEKSLKIIENLIFL